MPKLHYAREPNAPKRLEPSWAGSYGDFAVTLDNSLKLAGAPDGS